MSLRILHVFDHSIPLQSGYTFRSRAILREQRRLGWQTFHLTSPKHVAPGGDEEEVDGLHFFRTRWQPSGLASLPVAREFALMRALERRLLDVCGRVQPQVLHVHSPVLNAIPAIRVGRRLGIPVLYEVRAFWEDAAVDHGTSSEWGLRYRASRALETWALRHADHVTTICEGLRVDIVARGIDAARVTVIPNAVDVDDFQFGRPADEELKAKLGLQAKTVIGFIGSFYAYEGLDLLIDALPRLVMARDNLRLLLVGGGPQEAPLKQRAAERGVADRVVFTGRVPHAEVQRYYSVVDAFVYPRRSMRLTELVTPLKPLEAMAQGHLLVASDVGGHRELIRDGSTGVLFKAGRADALAEAVLRLLAAQADWPHFRSEGRAFVERDRTWTRSAAHYVSVFNRLVPASAFVAAPLGA